MIDYNVNRDVLSQIDPQNEFFFQKIEHIFNLREVIIFDTYRVFHHKETQVILAPLKPHL